MGYEVSLLDSALEDVGTIVTYLSQFYPSTPEKFLASLEKVKLNLLFMPSMYPIYDDMPIFRKVVMGKYLVFFTVDDKKKIVEIHRILPGSWDITRHLSEL
jgi:plasmid stabilization system protein ParE